MTDDQKAAACVDAFRPLGSLGVPAWAVDAAREIALQVKQFSAMPVTAEQEAAFASAIARKFRLAESGKRVKEAMEMLDG